MAWIEFRQNNEKLKFGIFPTPDVGDSSTFSFNAHNIADDVVTLTPRMIEDADLTIEEYPKRLEVGESGQVVLRFHAPMDRRKALNRVMVAFDEILGEI